MIRQLTIAILSFLLCWNISDAQELRGTIFSKDYFIDTDLRKVDDYQLSSKGITNDTIYSVKHICGDTIFWDSGEMKQKSGNAMKSVQFGEKGYIKSANENYYFRYKGPRNVEASFESKDWKKTKGKIKKIGLDYYAQVPGQETMKLYASIDTFRQYPNLRALKGMYTHLLTPLGLKTKSGFTNGDIFTIREFQFIPDSTLRCSEFLTDFWINDSETFDWYKEAIISEITTEIVPKADRKALAPAEFKDTYGEPTFLDDLQGKYIYIDFWASWCSPCRAEIPYLKKVKQQYEDQNLAFLSLSIDDELNAWQWKAVSEKLEIDWHNWLLEYGKDSSLAKGIQLSGIPRYILLDPEGKIVNDSAPRPSDQKLIELLDKVLSEDKN